MKILHLMLACFYIDKYSYQENLLPKYHKKAGHDVEIVASLFTFDENGNGKWLEKTDRYTNEHGIPVTRLEFSKGKFSSRLRHYVGLMDELERIKQETLSAVVEREVYPRGKDNDDDTQIYYTSMEKYVERLDAMKGLSADEDRMASEVMKLLKEITL